MGMIKEVVTICTTSFIYIEICIIQGIEGLVNIIKDAIY